MKRLAPLLFLFAAFCSSGGGTGTVTQPGHGAISIEIIPNPIRAAHVGGDTYDFPFEVVVRETGGRAVNITRVTADIFAIGGIRVGSESYDAQRIQSLGYSTRVSANGELRYRFNPRRSVPDDRLFGGVHAEVKVDGVDESGTATTARTNVTVTRP